MLLWPRWCGYGAGIVGAEEGHVKNAVSILLLVCYFIDTVQTCSPYGHPGPRAMHRRHKRQKYKGGGGVKADEEVVVSIGEDSSD